MGEQVERRANRPYWQIGFLVAAIVLNLWGGLTGNGRDQVAVGLAILVMAVPFSIAWRRHHTFATVVLLITILVSPWVFGLSANTLRGWNDHVWLSGRYYNRSQYVDVTGGSQRWESPYALAFASTWLPSPSVAVGTSFSPTVLHFEALDGTKLVYELVGGS